MASVASRGPAPPRRGRAPGVRASKVHQAQPEVRVGHALVCHECLLQPGAGLRQQGEIEGGPALLLQQGMKDGRESQDELQPWCTWGAGQLTLAGLKKRGEHLVAGLAGGRGRGNLPASLKIGYYPPH